MADEETYNLSKKYKVYKYIPYGHKNILVPYLMRRLNE